MIDKYLKKKKLQMSKQNTEVKDLYVTFKRNGGKTGFLHSQQSYPFRA